MDTALDKCLSFLPRGWENFEGALRCLQGSPEDRLLELLA